MTEIRGIALKQEQKTIHELVSRETMACRTKVILIIIHVIRHGSISVGASSACKFTQLSLPR